MNNLSEQSIFLDAIETGSFEARAALLERACGDDSHLRAEVDALLAAHDRLGIKLPNLDEDGPNELIGTRIGHYVLKEQIGEGGFGLVFEAEQLEPVRRRVALKIIKQGMDSREVLARFAAERQALALMDHANIAKVLDAGATATGRPYFVMELVRGVSIAKYCDDARLSIRERLELFIPVCQAIQHAHQKGILHRDLKPSNVLVAVCDGRPAPKVIDFGLAKALHQPLTENTIVSNLGMVLGTPEYMAPEQAETNTLDVDTRADIYSLGVILYELLTGSLPFDRRHLSGVALFELLRLIREQDPQTPSKKLSSIATLAETATSRRSDPKQLPRLLRGELDWIVMKCLNKERSKRYDNATSLADDVQRYLRGEPIVARPIGRLERTVKWARRQPALAALTAVSILAAAALVGGGLYYNAKLFGKQQRLDRQEADLAQLDRDLATERGRVGELNDLARSNLARSNLILADSNWKTGDALGTIKALAAVPVELRSWEWRFQQRRAMGSYRTLWGHTAPISSVAFSLDGALLATGSDDWTVKLWDTTTGALIRTLSGHTGAVTSVAFSPDSARMASGSDDNSIRFWDATTGSPLQTLSENVGLVRAVAFSPDGARLASGSDDSTVRLWDAKAGVLVRTLGHPGQVFGVAFSPDGSRLASGASDNTVKVWNATTGDLVHTLAGHTTIVRAVAFSPDGVRLASASDDFNVKLWDAQAGVLNLTLTGHTRQVRSVAFSPDGARLASTDDDSSVRLWDARSGAIIQTLTGHTRQVNSVAFSSDGARLATGGVDNSVKLWDVRSKAGAFTFTGSKRTGTGVAFSADGLYLASAEDDNAVKLWDVKSGALDRSFTGHTGFVRGVAFSPDKSRLASASEDKTIKIWNTSTGEVVQTLTGHSQTVCGVAFSPDGARLASAGEDKTVKVWNAATGEVVLTLTGHNREIRAVVFSPDGLRLASASEDNTIKLWDARTGAIVETLTGHTAGVHCLAFSNDGSRLASGSFDATVRLWDATNGNAIHTLTGHAHGVRGAVAFSPDGARLASGSEDNSVKLWDVRTGAMVQTLYGHSGAVNSVVFNPDGGSLASVSADGTVRLWDAKIPAEILVLTGHTKWVRGVAFSLDGSHLVSGSYDNTSKLWDPRTGAMIRTFTHNNWVTSVAFGPEGTTMVTGGWDRTAKLWDIKTGELIQTFTGNTAPVLGVAFSPDGARLATRDRNRVIKVWDVKTAKETTDAGAAEWLQKTATASRSPDGQQFAVGHGDGTVLLVKPLPVDETELDFLRAMARADVAWHWQQAQRYQKEKDWFAVRFHCEQVLKSRPDDAAAKKLLETVQESAGPQVPKLTMKYFSAS